MIIMTKKSSKSKSDGQLSDGTDAGFWLDWLSPEEIKALPGERKKPDQPKGGKNGSTR